MGILMKRNNSYGYTRMEKEDLEERKRREAQFLIYKTLKQVDQVVGIRSSSSSSLSSKPSWLRLRICKLKIKIGKRLMRLRKTMLSRMAKSKVGVCQHLLSQLKGFKRLFNGGGGSSGGRGGGAAIGHHLSHPFFNA